MPDYRPVARLASPSAGPWLTLHVRPTVLPPLGGPCWLAFRADLSHYVHRQRDTGIERQPLGAPRPAGAPDDAHCTLWGAYSPSLRRFTRDRYMYAAPDWTLRRIADYLTVYAARRNWQHDPVPLPVAAMRRGQRHR